MSKTILFVDDSPSVLQLASIVLGGEGYEMVVAHDGVEGLDKLRGRKFHLIFSDINMPHMDGISFIQAVKADAGHRFTPIVVLSTRSEEELRQTAREAGVKAWMIKPFDSRKLIEMASRFALP